MNYKQRWEKVFDLFLCMILQNSISLLLSSFMLFDIMQIDLWLLNMTAENDTHDGKRKCETLWPIFKIAHQKSRYIFDLYHRRKEISKELYEFCLDQGYADRNLIAKWKKVCLLACLRIFFSDLIFICWRKGKRVWGCVCVFVGGGGVNPWFWKRVVLLLKQKLHLLTYVHSLKW